MKRKINTGRIEVLREQMHMAIDIDNKQKVLVISQELDYEIVKFIKNKMNKQIAKSKIKGTESVNMERSC